MGTQGPGELTGLLQAWGQGDEAALQKLVPLVYDQLHVAAQLLPAEKHRKPASNWSQTSAQRGGCP